MSGAASPDDGLDVRRRRTRFRAWHRGMREMDLILGRFADAEIARLSEDEIDAFDALMEEQDRDLFAWLTGELPLAMRADTPFFHKLAAFTGAMPRSAD